MGGQGGAKKKIGFSFATLKERVVGPNKDLIYIIYLKERVVGPNKDRRKPQ